MITIQNVSDHDSSLKYGEGEQLYLLYINNTLIVQFNHVFEHGLAECLRSAADAVDEVNSE